MPGTGLEKLIELIQQSEKSYHPSHAVREALQQKTLVMLVGPVAVGKSFVIEHTIQSDSEFKHTMSFTTREARPDDQQGQVKTIPHTVKTLSRILEDIKQGNLVQFVVHPTTHNVYGTKPEDYSAPYNLLPTLSTVAESLSKLPFKQTITICLVTRPEIWKTWLEERYPAKSAERTKRINEAIISLKWMLTNQQRSDVIFLENSPSAPDKTIENLINIVKYKEQGDSKAREYAEQMLAFAESEDREV